MRRDLFYGFAVASLINGGLACWSAWAPARPLWARPAAPDTALVVLQVPPPPAEPEMSEDPQPERRLVIAPPSIPDRAAVPRPDQFIQQLGVPAPDHQSVDPQMLTIPEGIVPGPVRPESPWDPSKLDERPTARATYRPIYPTEMKRGGYEGSVLVGFIVDSAGAVRNAFALSSTRSEFEDAAVRGVSRWTFQPGRKGGRTVSTRMQILIQFSLDRGP